MKMNVTKIRYDDMNWMQQDRRKVHWRSVVNTVVSLRFS
jgi:hypothetical protein